MLKYRKRLFGEKLFFHFKSYFYVLFVISLFYKNGLWAKQNETIIENEITLAPKLILNRNIYDLGDINPNSKSKAIFNLTNSGNSTLLIEDIEKCCGAIIELDKKELATGESTSLSVEYYLSVGLGTFDKAIFLKTNDPNNPKTKLIIKGTMIQTLKWEPKSYEIASFGKDQNCPEIKIKSLDNTKFSVKYFAASGNCLSAEYDPNYSAQEIILKPKLIAEKLKELNTNSGSVLIELNHPDYKQISLNFDVIPTLQATPTQIVVFNADVNEPITKSIVLQDNEKHNKSNISKQIKSITSENGTQVELIDSSMSDKNCKLDLKIAPVAKKGSESLLKDQIIIELKDGRTLNIPMRIFYATQTLTIKAN